MTISVRYIDDRVELSHRLIVQISKATGVPASALFAPMFDLSDALHFAIARDGSVESGNSIKVLVELSY